MKKILSVTGTRADYGIYAPVYRAITESKNLSLELAVVGMHLLPEFGRSVDAIKKDGFTITAELNTMTNEDTPRSMAEFVGKTTVEFARILSEHRPDVLLLLGDRGEQLAAATAAVYLRIPIAHLHGGEQSGSVDDPVRHAITHMAAIHLATAPENAEHIRRMRGPATPHIHVVGAPALDVIRTLDAIPKDQLFTDAGFDPSLPCLVFVQHPDTTDALSPEEQLKPSLTSLEAFSGNILIVGSNADAGGSHMNEMLRAFAKAGERRAFKITVPHREFLSWEKCADVLMGNSSSGIIEAASFRLPVVNVGGRQRGRLRSGNVLDVPYDAAAITAAISKAVSPAFRKSLAKIRNAYGDGHAAEKIVEILEKFGPSGM
ncbi:MAG: UDP-N-acetylglucosamine 2-epimerase (hydrolyzing) [Candidatus Peribacteraceae bacterium]|nr:UDP-N-acetylglucosamine 2-epimerase (hydrolyzing) [Candidatus Peribacteraceae bacterium]